MTLLFPTPRSSDLHGGGFYHNEKYQVAPSHMPDDLHWFKWEAYFTWISGFSLLVLVYYVGAKNFLIDPAKMALGAEDATIIGLSALIAGWLFYHLACKSPLGRDNRVLGAVWFLFLLEIGRASCRERVCQYV